MAMKLHTVFITYNRLELTKQAIFSYRETVTVPHTFSVVDNNSSDDTKKWLLNSGFDCHLLTQNRYPGYACNLAWSYAPKDATHLHRADNDFKFLEGWCEQVEELFREEKVGQVGLRTHAEEDGDGNGRWNVGGNCVIRRELWDAGLRYDERPWPEFPPGYSEDSFFSPAVEEKGYTWTRVTRPSIQNLATGDWGDSYYQESYGIRGIRPHPDDPTLTPELKEKLL